MQDWILENKEWLFSGLGIAAVSTLFVVVRYIKNTKSNRKRDFKVTNFDKNAYRLGQVISLQVVFVAALVKKENDLDLRNMKEEGFEHLIDLSYKCSIPETILNPLLEVVKTSNPNETLSLFSRYVVALNAFFEREAEGSIGLSYFSALIVQHAEDLDVIHDHIMSSIKACSRIESEALPEQVRDILKPKVIRKIETKNDLPSEIPKFVEWAKSTYA